MTKLPHRAGRRSSPCTPPTATDALLAALERAVQFRRWRADDVRSILAAAGAAPPPRPAGQALVLTLPAVPTRSLDDYAIIDGGEPS